MTTSIIGAQRLGGDPKIKLIFLELRITNQQMHLHPPIEVAKEELFLALANWEDIILKLPRIQHSRYQVCQSIRNLKQITMFKVKTELYRS